MQIDENNVAEERKDKAMSDASEISPEQLIPLLKPADHYALVAIEGERNACAMILQRGDFIRCCKALIKGMIDEMYSETDYDVEKTKQICRDIYADVESDWLSEISPEEDI